MNLTIKKAGQADKVVTVTLGNLIWENYRLNLEVNAPGGKTYYIPLIPGPNPKSEEEPQ